MRTSLKVIVIAGIIILTSLIGIALNGGNGNNKAPIFVLAGAIAAIRAVWKYKPTEEKDTSVDLQQLDKK